MTHAELETKINAIIPGASFERDNDGQIVIYTGLVYDEASGELVDFEPPEE